MKFTGEFYVPEVHGNIELEHVHRYLQACEIADNKIVLDIASGEGYGSAMLAERAARVTGVDVSKEVVDHARGKYRRSNLEYLIGSCSDIPLPDKSIDLVVSFETLEHHSEHEAMMREITRVLRTDGSVLISTPDRYQYSVEPGHNNPFHVKELYEHEFKTLITLHFRNAIFFGQRVVYGSSLFAEEQALPTTWYWKADDDSRVSSGRNRPLYWVALASNAELPALSSGVFEQPIDHADAVLAYRDALTERDGQLAELTTAVAGFELELTTAVAGFELERSELSEAVANRESQIAALNERLQELEQSLEHAVAAGNEQIALQRRALESQQREITELQDLADELALIKTSRLLRLRDVVRGEPFGVRKLAHIGSLSLPLALSQRRRHKASVSVVNLGRPSEDRGFDAAFYLMEYPDVAAAGMDPRDHYLRHGKAEGRLPRRPQTVSDDRLSTNPGLLSEALPEFALPSDADEYRPLVSIIVPTYNHAEFLQERLDSIYQQTYQGGVEIYLLDDASTDGSPSTLRSFARRFPDKTTVITNTENSGSAFRQWRRGLDLARGDIVWIAESDDLCDRNFLATMIPLMANPAVMLAFSNTVFFKEAKSNIVLTLEHYLRDVGPFRFDIPWIQPGASLVAAGFAEKNLVPNVSGAVFRHPRTMDFLDSHEWLDMRLAGDWIFYLEVIKCGLVAYSPATTNYHRSTETTLTSKTNASSAILAREVAQARLAAHRIYGVEAAATQTSQLTESRSQSYSKP